MRIKKGDNVIILSGKDKGKKGTIARVLTGTNRVIIEGANVVKRHQKPRKSGQKGSIVDVALPIHVSNVALLDPKSGKGTRFGTTQKGGKMVRISKKSGAEI
ncbi:MAG: 50S ribosomal protein L24 [Patescibacteria group bacterium]